MATPLQVDTREAAFAVNLPMLQRFDPHVAEILAVASHVAMYTFDTAAQHWVRACAPGPLALRR